MSRNDLHSPAALLNPPAGARDASPARMPAVRLTDKFGRTISDLRVSITDRCNYKCVYCRTGSQGAQFAELAMDDYLRIIRVFVSLGIEKIRLTGGEPLLRKGLVPLLTELAQLRTQSAGDPAGPCHHHQWTPSGRDGRSSGAGRAQPDHGQHGRGRRSHL